MYDRTSTAFLLVVGAILGWIASDVAHSSDKSPPASIYDSQTIAILRFEKDMAESLSSVAKERKDAANGRLFYANAMADQNCLIAKLIVSLGEPETKELDDARKQLQARADKAYGALYGWLRPQPKSGLSTGEPGADGLGLGIPESAGDIGAIIVGFAQIQAAKAQEQRSSASDELRQCEWRPWKDL
jgi:hypothetical protein